MIRDKNKYLQMFKNRAYLPFLSRDTIQNVIETPLWADQYQSNKELLDQIKKQSSFWNIQIMR